MGRTPAKRKFSDNLEPVSPGESGQGLPYAPVDWPNSGDIWRWAATGKAIKRNGIYKDRLLSAPERLQRRSSKKLAFMSKISVEHYLRSEFPEADINAFFQSFTWDIPAKTDSERKGKFAICTQSVASQEENRRFERGGGIFKRTRQSSLRQKSQGPSSVTELTIDLTMEEEGPLAGTATTKFMSSLTGSVDDNVWGSLPDCKLKAPNFAPEEFDNYLNSLDEIFALPCPVNHVTSKSSGMIEARQKLSSLLAMGFPSLVSSNRLDELLALTSELQNDPSISHKELPILKLIQEITLTSQRYLEVKEAYTQADKFFADLDSLDEIFDLPCPVNHVTSKSGGMIEARQKLCSLLAMGFPSLVSSNKLNELLALTSELQNDPSISHKELPILKLIQEITLTSRRYLEVKEASTQADKFFADLDSKIVSVASLKNEYISAKEEKEVLQAEEASTLLAILETDEQIAKLQSRRMALAEIIKVTNKRIVQCSFTQQKVMDCLPKIVHEVRVANSKKAEWELKKKNLAEQEAQILAKFAPLTGFSF